MPLPLRRPRRTTVSKCLYARGFSMKACQTSKTSSGGIGSAGPSSSSSTTVRDHARNLAAAVRQKRSQASPAALLHGLLEVDEGVEELEVRGALGRGREANGVRGGGGLGAGLGLCWHRSRGGRSKVKKIVV